MAGRVRAAGRQVWQTLSSIKTGVVLLITTVILSAAGTLVLQRPITEPEEMQRAYSPQMLRLLDAVGLTDVFHAWWFVLLLMLVSASIICASIQRFPNAWRYYARPYKSPDESFRKALPTQKRIAMPDAACGLGAAERAFRRLGLQAERVENGEQVSLFAERHRISEMAVYIVHLSLLLIFLGGIVDGLYGWRGYLALVSGQQSNRVELHDSSSRTLPFAIRCDGAGQQNYADGSPKRWWSKLAVVEDGREALRKEIAVNDPLVYRGVRFYQSNYGPTGKLDKLLLTATPAAGKGEAKEIELGLGETVALDADTTVRLAQFIPDYVVRDGQVYTRSNQVENPAAQLFVESKKLKKTVEAWLPPIPGFAHNQESPYQFEARDLQMEHFTGLQVSHEPGQWAVWGGVMLMGLGLAVAFYLAHTRFWAVPVRDARGQWALWVGGTANKNREVFEQRFRRLVQEIESEVKKVEGESRAKAREAVLAGD